MPAISQKGSIMPSSPVRKLVPFAEAAKKRGIHIYPLNIGQPDIKTPSQAIQAVKNTDMEILSYSHSAGNESYRKKLAAHYNKIDMGLSIDDIKNKSKIKKSYLEALENDNYKKLPGEVYTKVYIRGYAKIVDLDPQEILAEYENEKNF